MARFLALAALLALAVPVHASHNILPKQEMTEETQLWLTKMFIIEAGLDTSWTVRREHALLAYIVLDRYKIRKRRNPDETFVDTVRAYSNGLKKDRRRFTPKMKWTLALRPPTESSDPPKFWPKSLSWKKHMRAYRRTWDHAGRWMAGNVANPCPGAAHWGMPGVDPVPQGMRLLACSHKFKNDIYGR